MKEASVAGSAPAQVCLTGSPAPRAPPARDGGGCPATLGGTSVQLERLSLSHAPQAMNLWLRHELSLSADRA